MSSVFFKQSSGVNRAAVVLLGAAGLFVVVGGVQGQDDEAKVEYEQQVEHVHQGIPHDAIYAMDIAGDYGVAVGAYGLIMESKDSGSTWAPVESPTTRALLGVKIKGERRIAVGQQGTVLLGADGGSWRLATGAPDLRLLNVAMNEQGLTAAVGEFGLILISEDGGESWQRVSSIDWMEYNEDGYEPHLYDAVVDDNGQIMVAGEFGLILASTDHGASWTPRHQGEESIFALHMGTNVDDAAIAVGQEGAVLRSTDQGMTWSAVKVPSNANLLGAWSGNGEVVITGVRDMLRSSDNGKTWSSSKDVGIMRNWYQAVAPGVVEVAAGKGFLRQQVVYVAGYRGTISRVLF